MLNPRWMSRLSCAASSLLLLGACAAQIGDETASPYEPEEPVAVAVEALGTTRYVTTLYDQSVQRRTADSQWSDTGFAFGRARLDGSMGQFGTVDFSNNSVSVLPTGFAGALVGLIRDGVNVYLATSQTLELWGFWDNTLLAIVPSSFTAPSPLCRLCRLGRRRRACVDL